MKISRNYFALFTLAIGGLLFTSCKKDYACQCTATLVVPSYTVDGQTYPEEVTVNTVTNNFTSKKKDAKSGCSQGDSYSSYPSPFSYVGQGPTVETVTCELK